MFSEVSLSMKTSNPLFTTSGANPDEPAPRAPAVERAAQGAHEVIDRLANAAGPAVEHMSNGVSAAVRSVRSTTHGATATRDAWMESSRASVREHPMTALAIAAAAGCLLGRLLSRR
jgi:ElaB/YqjD/DUF883 family membrane-anchored ribosome-binding protein